MKLQRVLPHLLVWCILFIFPVTLSISEEEPREIGFYVRQFAPLVFTLMLFYINYYWLIERYYFKNEVWYFLGINIFLICLSIWLMSIFREVLAFMPLELKGHHHMKHAMHRHGLGKYFGQFRSLLILLFSIAASVAVKASKRLYEVESIRKNLENEHLKSELTQLKYQLQPHFFFNVLNTIYSMVEVAPENAKDSIHRLSKLMRYLLYETNDEKIALHKEIEFLQNYITLMRQRLATHVDVETSFPPSVDQIKIAPLLFIALVENAFKHSVSASKSSFVRIELLVTANEITLNTKNSNFPQLGYGIDHAGIGLDNLEKRLELLYPNNYYLKNEVIGDSYHASLTIIIKK